MVGIENPLAWMESIPAREFAHWKAYYKREPFGDDWRQTATLARMLDRLFSAQVASNDYKVADEEVFMPPGTGRSKPAIGVAVVNGKVVDEGLESLKRLGEKVRDFPKFAEVQASRKKAKVSL